MYCTEDSECSRPNLDPWENWELPCLYLECNPDSS